ncbi:two-component system OmpR family sensor kinase [Catenuloplanes nepalensis]|uniref:histidine kinase n=1 Tax=Catenuloplanes nepalensis TaxID=587533 RepID=A0ABT9N222_9ACTN|nr:HAMP domain-containing sensor histidine kinase [Catenuloplanes nepalensis]MDP9797553.1 two-component system OmpR family sensor kinase [Catenuloplanes nepalensis]
MKARLRSTPLRLKLVASVLVLVGVALIVISVSSAYFLRSYLVRLVDDQLHQIANDANAAAMFVNGGEVTVPTDYYGRVTAVSGVGKDPVYDGHLGLDDLPPQVEGREEITAVAGEAYTVKSINGKIRWRMLVQELPNGEVLHIGENLGQVDLAVKRLIWIDGLVGGAVLIMLASIGAGMVRASLRPLDQIEQTAGAIAAGDLSRRVPDPEPGIEEPQSELGRLSRALNGMLTQIEAGFAARAASEAAARSAETIARDAALHAQASEARALNSESRMRQFVADASHELRTPLTTIRGFAELYRQGAATDAPKLVRRIEDEAARMGLLVEDLLLLARLDRERPLALNPVELPVLAADAVQAARAMAPDRTITLDIAPGSGPLVVTGDESRLRQVFGNLMTNALTHTPADASVTLRLRAEADADGRRVAGVVEVTDTGGGLTQEQIDRVFERFYRADAARTRTAAGTISTGLGLAIVAAIVSSHDGVVEVESTPGDGATFRVRLPLVPTELDADSDDADDELEDFLEDEGASVVASDIRPDKP